MADYDIRHCGSYDIIVVGGGVAGIAAAVAAAHGGGSVLLVEKSIALGGLATIGLINWYEPLCDGAGCQMCGGIAEELLRLAIRYGFDDLPPDWVDGTAVKEPRAGRYASFFSPTMAIMAFDEYVQSHGVQLRFDTWATRPVMAGNICTGVICEDAGGSVLYEAKVVVDATGDASVLCRAGAPTELGDNYLSLYAHYTDRETAQEYANGGNGAKARQWVVAGSDLFGNGHADGQMYRCETGKDVTEFVLKGRARLLDKLREQPRQDRDITMLPMMPQYRKIRRLVGEYTFMGDEDNQPFDDAVGSMGDFRKKGRRFQLPYRTLYNRAWPNLLAAGRVISAVGDGWEITRVIPVAALSGHAAGAAAVLAAGKCAVSEVDTAALRDTLARQGVLFRI